MKAIHFETKNWPILEIKIRATMPSEAELHEYLQSMEKMYEQPEPFVSIYDARLVNYIVPSSYRVQLGRFIKEHESAIRNKVQAYVFVLPSVFGRIILKGVLLVAPLPVPHYVVNEMEEAYALAKEYTGKVAA